MCRKMKLEYLFTPKWITRINSKWVKDLNVRSQTIKVSEENRQQNLRYCLQNFLIRYISPGRGNKRKNKQMGLNQTRKFLQNKGNDQQNKKTTHKMKEHIHHQGLISKIYKLHTKLNTKKQKQKTNPIKKWAKDLNRHFSKEGIQMANRL